MNLTEKAKKISDGAATLFEWVGADGVTCEQETAQARTEICLKCEFNKSGSIVTEIVAKGIKKAMEIKNSVGLRTKGIKSLKTCEKCSCFLPLKIFVPINIIRRRMTTDSLSQMPDWCWQVTEKL